MKNKGFTLVELLAVIVILAIIALIATPIVLNIIEDTRESATKRSGEFYLAAVEQAIMSENLDGDYFSPEECEIQSNGNLLCDEEIPVEVDVDGLKPAAGTITFANGKVAIGTTIKFDDSNSFEVTDKGLVKVENDDNQSSIVSCTGGTNIGNEVTCGNESFNVLSSTSSTVTMLAKNFITPSSTSSGVGYTNRNNEVKATLLSSKNAKVVDSTQNSSAGTTAFSTTFFWTSVDIASYESFGNVEYYNIDSLLLETKLNTSLNLYKTYLQTQLDTNSIKIRLLNVNDLIRLGCTHQEYGLPSDSIVCGTTYRWLSDTNNYWLGSVDASGNVYVMAPGYDDDPENEGYEYLGVALLKSYSSTAGIRPVVTIPREKIN